jgi:peroxiredoxin
VSSTAPRRLLLVTVMLVALGCGREDDTPHLPGPGQGVIDPVSVKALRMLSLPDLNGTQQALAQWDGKILVLNYWASWCAPCKEEMPAFSRLYERHASNGVQFVGISIDSPDKVRQFQKDTPVTYPLLLGSMDTMQVVSGLGNSMQGLPFTVILDRQGEVHSTKLGRFSEAVLDQRLQSLIKP